jgi:hypothetical protein
MWSDARALGRCDPSFQHESVRCGRTLIANLGSSRRARLGRSGALQFKPVGVEDLDRDARRIVQPDVVLVSGIDAGHNPGPVTAGRTSQAGNEKV